jgi:hypothetical protein
MPAVMTAILLAMFVAGTVVALCRLLALDDE